jgi:hypothetical protein
MKKIAAITSHETPKFLDKITPRKTQCGKTSSSVWGFYYAAENIETSYKTNLLMIAASCDILQDTFSSGLS